MRDVTRFLWLKDPTKSLESSNILCYRFTRVPFGVMASSFVLAATLKYHFLKNNLTFSQQYFHQIYVDNLVTSVSNIDTAQQLYDTINSLFQLLVSLTLAQRAWNKVEIRQLFPPHLAIQKTPTKLLGLLWTFKTDRISLQEKISLSTIYTKKTTLQHMSSIYDALGWFQPALIPAKALIKKLWNLNLDWDEPIADNLINPTKTMSQELLLCTPVNLPRQRFTLPFDPKQCAIAHVCRCFCYCICSSCVSQINYSHQHKHSSSTKESKNHSFQTYDHTRITAACCINWSQTSRLLKIGIPSLYYAYIRG